MNNPTQLSNQTIEYIKKSKQIAFIAWLFHVIILTAAVSLSIYYKSYTGITCYAGLMAINNLIRITNVNKASRFKSGLEYVIRPVAIWKHDLVHLCFVLSLAFSGLIFAPLMLLLATACFNKSYIDVDTSN